MLTFQTKSKFKECNLRNANTRQVLQTDTYCFSVLRSIKIILQHLLSADMEFSKQLVLSVNPRAISVNNIVDDAKSVNE